MTKIGIYGGGSFGTALACQSARSVGESYLFLRNEFVRDEIIEFKTNSKYFGDILIDENIHVSCNIKNIINCDIIILSIPSFAFYESLINLQNFNLPKSTILLIATKSFSDNPFTLLDSLVSSIFPNNPVAFISGPNIAKDIVQNLFTTATIASTNLEIAKKLSKFMTSENFIIDASDDIVTLQISAAMKNIIAIACGIYEGQNRGQNALASLIVKGLQEIKTLSQFIQYKDDVIINETLLKTGIIGDLILTCYSKTSRNKNFGYDIGIESHNISQYHNIVVEGRDSCLILKKFIDQNNVNLPIINFVFENIKYTRR
jgi:glycerol-3-phosphate dehydrogenase (NAD(P)+)